MNFKAFKNKMIESGKEISKKISIKKGEVSHSASKKLKEVLPIEVIQEKIAGVRQLARDDISNPANYMSMATLLGGVVMFELSKTADTHVPIDSMSDQGLFVAGSLVMVGIAYNLLDSKLGRALVEQVSKITFEKNDDYLFSDKQESMRQELKKEEYRKVDPNVN
ncbi:hypothetical protein HOK00_11120 [bacterium]|jgi:hypothetical protein|nr:hypothetical protein [bacterium]